VGRGGEVNKEGIFPEKRGPFLPRKGEGGEKGRYKSWEPGKRALFRF